MQIPKMTRGRLIALAIIAVTVLGLAALGGAEFWAFVKGVLA